MKTIKTSLQLFPEKFLALAMAFIIFTLMFSFEGSSAVVAQGEPRYIDLLRAFDQDTVGALNPMGLAYSPLANELLVLESVGPDQSPLPVSEFIRITSSEDWSGSVAIAASISDPINIAFDSKGQRLLFLRSSQSNLFEVRVDSDGILLQGTLKPHNSNKLGIRDPQGMAFDPESGDLFVLDGDGPRLLHITPDAQGGFQDAVVEEVNLDQAGFAGLRGLAYDSTNGHIHLFNPAEQMLYEITQSGLVVATRDLSNFGLSDPQGIVIAPSGDRTDDPAQISLYVADSGPIAGQGRQSEMKSPEARSAKGPEQEQSSGQIVEFTFTQPLALAEADYTSSLVQIILGSQWSPPSPDTAGIVYLPHKDRLLASDSEVNEMPLYDGVNLFEISYNGDVLDTGTTLVPSNSNEPTGVAYNENNGELFISDDNKKEIYIFKAGSDGIFGTNDDDPPTSFDTEVFGSSDPEGVTFDSSGQGTLYIADGVNAEVYIVTPGPNGDFDGIDDVVTNFDTYPNNVGVRDPEGIAFNPDTSTLYLVGNPPTNVLEVTTAGDPVRNIDISAANGDNPAGLAYAPGSNNPNTFNLYIAERGVDNNSDPSENDGKIYEVTLPPLPLQPPVAVDDSDTTNMDTAVIIDVAANDSDADGNLDPSSANSTCTYGSAGCAGAADGSLTDNGDGTITYMPNLDFTGVDSFIYEICDVGQLCDTAIVTVTVTPPNDPPLAVDDSANTLEDEAVIINVSGNDSDPDGNLDANSANSVCTNGSSGCLGAASGSLTDNGDGTITYTPNEDVNGSDSFLYEICDTFSVCATATVNITVDPVADPPSAVDDNASTVVDVAITIGVANNDSDADGNLDPSSANSLCTYSGSTDCVGAANGSLTDNGDGTITYMPNLGFTGDDSFTYEICDATQLCNTAVVIVTVGAGVIDVRVAAGEDDAEERPTGSVIAGSSDLEFTLDRTYIQIVGMRFNGVEIPQGSIIEKAYVQFQADEANSEVTNLTIEGEDKDNAEAFAALSGNISSRPRTFASVPWSPPPWTSVGEAGVNQQTSDISAVIEEIVNRPNWSSGNSLALIISGDGKRVAESYNGVAAAAPLLHVEYTSTGNRLPNVAISAPAYNSTYNEGYNIGFSGTASDFEDGDLTASLVWTSDLDGPIGSGSSFFKSDLSVGVHTITGAVTDSGGQTAFDEITITVFADVPILVGAGDIADSDLRSQFTAELLDTIPGTVYTTGDNAYPDGTLAEYMAFYEPTWGRHKARTLPTSGNHEYATPGASGYYQYFGAAAGDPDKGYYSYDVGDWHIISLNSECSELEPDGCGINSLQGQWLQADLAANPSTCTLAYWHRPLFSSNGGSSSVQDLWTILYAAKADVILNGHVHNYERFAPQDPFGSADPDGIRQFVVGTGGGGHSTLPLTPAPNVEARDDQSFGVLKLTLHPTSYDWEYIPIAGDTFTDSGSAPCVTNNLPPLANDDSAVTNEDIAVNINVIANDSDPDGTLDPSTANTSCVDCSEPANGTVVNQGNGSFDYTPDLDFNGSDSFVYQVCDNEAACSTATVSITVNPTADPPLANDDMASTSEDTVVKINVTANDTDPDGNLDPTTANTSCASCWNPGAGTLINNGDGTFDYTPILGYSGPDNFFYEICDTDAACDTARVNITVTPTNDPPLAVGDSVATDEDTAVTINVAVNDSDPDGNLDLTTANSSCANGSSGCNSAANGSLVDNGDGTISYTPNSNFNGSDSFVYEICDTFGLCDTATVTVTITAVADPPLAADDSDTTVEMTTVIIDVAANDSDPENDLDPATANSICANGSAGCNGAANGTLADGGDGTISYTPNPGFTGNDSFVYEICDATGLCATGTVTIGVVSAAPDIFEVRVAMSTDDAEEHATGRVSLPSSDLEMTEEKDTQVVGLRFNGVNVPQGSTITNAYIQFQVDEVNSEATTLNIVGQDSDNPDTFINSSFNISDTTLRPQTTAAATWVPAPWLTRNVAGPDQQTSDIASIIQEIVDRPGWTNGNSLVIIITGTGKRVADSFNGDPTGAPLLHVEYTALPNDPPLANDDSFGTFEDTAVAIDVVANDSDPNGNLDPASTNTICNGCNGPANGTLINHGDGTFNYTPDPDYNGGDSFVYEICDIRGACDTATVTLTVDAVNDPPVAEDDSIVTSKNTDGFVDVDANDSDVDGNLDPASVNTTCDTCSEPTNGALVNSGGGSFTYTPDLDFVGPDSFVYEICDTNAACDIGTVNVTVTPTNDPPLAIDDSFSLAEDTSDTIDVAANDSDPDGNLDPTTANTSCTSCTEPANGSLFNNGDGSFSYTPTADFNGDDSFTYEICDSYLACSMATVIITITPVNDLPMAVDDTATVDKNSSGNNISVLDNDDFGGDGPSTGSITLQGQPGNGAAAVNDGATPNDPTDDSIDYTPDPDYAGDDNFIYQICDSNGDCTQATAYITVTGQLPVNTLYISTTSNASASNPSGGGISFNDEDIVAYDLSTGEWSMFFDGSDVGLSTSSQEIDALHVEADGNILLSLGANDNLPGVGDVHEYDILRFIPSSLGDLTAGTYEIFFNGEDFGLDGDPADTTDDEDIDAIGFDPNGDLVISLRGSYNFGNISGGDEDMIVLDSGGSWQLYVDGSVVGLNDASSEDINGTWIDLNGDIYLTVRGVFDVTGVTGDGDDIFSCVPGSMSPITNCTFGPYWDGVANQLAANEVLNGISFGP